LILGGALEAERSPRYALPMSQPSTPPSVYHRHIVLRGISLLIWRRLLVRSDTTLTHLHAIRQIVSTQSDKTLYRFHTYDREYKSNGAQTSPVLPCDLGLLGVAVGQQFHGALQVGKLTVTCLRCLRGHCGRLGSSRQGVRVYS
jgi:hypothetical protein